MTATVGQPASRYSAFLSYSRADAGFARRLHRRLEAYRLPRRLIGRSPLWDPLSRRLRPIFRDVDELTAAPDLSDALKDALAASAFLIVISSPSAAASRWVGYEIEAFYALSKTENVLVALVTGDPASALHSALRRGLDTGPPRQPLAADFRPRNGQRLALLKLVAVLAGVRLGELIRRDAQRQRRNLVGAITAGAAILAVALVLTLVALHAREAAARESARSSSMSGFMLDKLRSDLKHYGNLGMLDAVNKNVLASFVGQDLAGLSDGERQQLAKLRLAMGEDAEKRGDLAGARKQIEEAHRITAAQLAALPNDPSRIFDDAQSQFYVALVGWRAGDRAAARTAFQNYYRMARQLVGIDPAKADWWMEVGYASENLGMYALRTTLDGTAAERDFRAALAAFQRADRLRSGDRDIASQIADTDAWLGDTLRIREDFAGALAARQAQRAILEALLAKDPRDKVVQVDLVSNELATARIAARQRQWATALAGLSRGREAAVALARDDPDNKRLASQVRIFDLFMLRTWLEMPVQPPAARMAEANGNCDDDRVRLKSAELADFCTILAGRRTGAPQSRAYISGNRLTEVWGLDLRREAAEPQARKGTAR